jgi:hypothetical protein
MIIIDELYQFVFISSIIFILYTLSSLGIKMYGRFSLKQENVTFKLSNVDKIILWIAIAIFFTYIIP